MYEHGTNIKGQSIKNVLPWASGLKSSITFWIFSNADASLTLRIMMFSSSAFQNSRLFEIDLHDSNMNMCFTSTQRIGGHNVIMVRLAEMHEWSRERNQQLSDSDGVLGSGRWALGGVESVE